MGLFSDLAILTFRSYDLKLPTAFAHADAEEKSKRVKLDTDIL